MSRNKYEKLDEERSIAVSDNDDFQKCGDCEREFPPPLYAPKEGLCEECYDRRWDEAHCEDYEADPWQWC